MKLPKQSAPVQRNITGGATSNQNGVEPSWIGAALGAAVPLIMDLLRK